MHFVHLSVRCANGSDWKIEMRLLSFHVTGTPVRVGTGTIGLTDLVLQRSSVDKSEDRSSPRATEPVPLRSEHVASSR